jgi:hypothetical protein
MIHAFLTSALLGGVVKFKPLTLYPGQRAPVTHWVGDWLDPRYGLDDACKRNSLSYRDSNFDALYRPAHNQSQYRLRYRGSSITVLKIPSSRPCPNIQ